MKSRLSRFYHLVVATGLLAPVAMGQCPTEPVFQNWTGAGTVVCSCFVPNEQIGAVLNVPAAHYPIEILKVQIGWGSPSGGQPDTLENNIHLYAGGLPNPGAPQFSVAGPVLSDGVINEFDLTLFPGNRIINSGPFMVALEFMNQTNQAPFPPTAVHDGNGCQSGKNAVFAIPPNSWFDACLLGVSGDWIMGVVYRQVNCCSMTAAWSNYGVGQPGTFGLPALLALNNPQIGSNLNLYLGNSQGTPSTGLLLLGLNPAMAPASWGGQIVVAATTSFLIPLAAGGNTIGGTIPPNPALCGVSTYLQLIQFDTGAPAGISSSLGLQLDLGN